MGGHLKKESCEGNSKRVRDGMSEVTCVKVVEGASSMAPSQGIQYMNVLPMVRNE